MGSSSREDASPGCRACGGPTPSELGPRAVRRRGQLFDWVLFAVAIGLAGSLLRSAAIAPNARRAERLERRAYALEREVDTTAREVARLRSEVTALQSDPYTIERTLKRRRRALRPDLFEPEQVGSEPLPAAAIRGDIRPPHPRR